ncbi:hypothetical protein GGI07_001593 [Coemansia sp. Benny D115]|nr:hypothetical protein GGI07_001593 [Coemansia sp. Benny D115]
MIDPDDCDNFNWAPELREPPGPMYDSYKFLNTIPLSTKKEMFRTMNHILSNYVLSDVLVGYKQMRWAMNIIKLGLQLPMEDVNIIADAFKKYSDVLFYLQRLNFENEDYIEEGGRDMLIYHATQELVYRPSILFNPRMFFHDELPMRTIRRQSSSNVVRVNESTMMPVDICTGDIEGAGDDGGHGGDTGGKGKQGSGSFSFSKKDTQNNKSANSTLMTLPFSNRADHTKEEAAAETHGSHRAFGEPHGASNSISGNHKPYVGSVTRPREDTSATTMSSATGKSGSQTLPSISNKTRYVQALDMWDRYVQILSQVMQTYSMMIRAVKPDIPVDIIISLAKRLLLVVDLILSQRGDSPRLQAWEGKYKPYIGDELWEKTWGTIGERLEYSAIKLAIDVWGRIIGMPNVPNDVLLRDFKHWLHRDNVLDAWLQMIRQVASRVLRAHYPYDKSIGTDTIHMRVLDFSMAGRTTDDEAKVLLRTYSQTEVNINLGSVVPDEATLRHNAYEAISALTAFVGYYHELGCSDLIADKDKRIQKCLNRCFTSENATTKCTPHTLKSLAEIFDKIEKSPFRDRAQEDPVFSEYLVLFFQVLLGSVITESDPANLQYVTCVTLTYLHQYSQYNPSYVQLFIEFYVEKLQNTRDDMLASVYVYGLMNSATTTWKHVLSEEQHIAILSAIISSLSTCDRDLKRYTEWNQYHQFFIGAIRCLCIWLSISAEDSLDASEMLSKLNNLLNRCNAFIGTSKPQTLSKHPELGRKIKLTTSTEYNNYVTRPGNINTVLGSPVRAISEELEIAANEPISSYTTLGIFSSDDQPVPLRSPNTKAKKKIRILEDSLYKVLSTTIGVFSTILLRRVDKEQYVNPHPPQDVLLMRMILYHNKIPNNETLLKACDPSIRNLLRDYRPFRVSFFSAYHRAIYSSISFKCFKDGKWSDAATLQTSRYPSGSKQWIALTSNPISLSSAKGAAAGKEPSMSNAQVGSFGVYKKQPWIRMAEGILICGRLRSRFDVEDTGYAFKRIEPLVDDEGEEAMESRTAEDYERLHGKRIEPDIVFTPCQPHQEFSRGNSHYRVNLYEHQTIDSSALKISEPLLCKLDYLDDLASPFSAYAGVIYLRSAKSLAEDRILAKGPLQGVSPEFNEFLSTLGRSRLGPAERMKKHPDDPMLMRYSFSEKGFEVKYDLAPNVSSLINGSKMGPQDNKRFYDLLYERGIYVLWFDRHSGSLDSELVWKFIDSRYTTDNRQASKAPSLSKSHSESASTPYIGHTDLEHKKHTGKPKYAFPELRDELRASTVQPDATSSRNGHDSSGLFKKAANRKESSGSDTLVHRFKGKGVGFLQKAMRITRRQTRQEEEMANLTRSNSEPGGLSQSGSSDDIQEYTGRRQSRKRSATQIPPAATPTASAGAAATELKHGDVIQRTARRLDEIKAGPSGGYRSSFKTAMSVPTSPLQVQPSDSEGFFEDADYQQSSQRHEPDADLSGKQPDATPKARVLIALAPIEHTSGKLVKITLSATGGTDQINRDFINMTGPLMSSMVVGAKDVASLLSATIMDASANLASLRGEDFSAIYRRIDMISSIIKDHCARYDSISELHRSMFPVGKSGVQSTFEIPLSIKQAPIGSVGIDEDVNDDGVGRRKYSF